MAGDKVEQNRKVLSNLKWPVIAYGLLAAGYTAMLPGSLIWYSWHPFFMILAFAPLTINAILFKKVGGYENTKTHGILMSLSTLAAGFAFYVIYTNKNAKNKPHFTSVHGKAGLGLLIAWLGLALVGSIGLHPDWGIVRTNKTIRFVHKWSGKVVSLVSWAALILQFMHMCDNIFAQLLFALPLSIFGVLALV